ncbi:MAG: hypothetical protein RL160_2084, partial [Bacteroidota bacterium]
DQQVQGPNKFNQGAEFRIQRAFGNFMR